MGTKKNINLAQILETALTLANEIGLEKLSLGEVAERLGIRTPSLYNHVAGLDGLREQLHLWATRQLNEILRQATIGKSGETALRNVAHAFRLFALQYPGVYALTQQAARPEQTELGLAQAEVIGVLLAILQPYGLSQEENLHTIRVIRSMVHGFVDLEASGGFGLALALDESFETLVQVMVVGLRQYLARRVE